MTAEMVDERTGEIAVIENNSTLTAQDIVKAGSSFATNIDLSTIESKLDVLNAMSNPEPLSDNEGVSIELRGFIAQETKFRDATGKLVDGVAVYLVGKNGETFISVSSGVATEVQRIVGFFGEDAAQWPEGLTVKPTKKKLEAGKTTWTFATTIAKKK